MTLDLSTDLDISQDDLKSWLRKGLIAPDPQGNFLPEDLIFVRDLNRGVFPAKSRYSVLSDPATSYTSIDLFAGAGGTALGLENAGFHHVLVNEFDAHASQTLQINRPEWNVVTADAETIDFRPYSGIDLIEAGFPCQAFSHAGRRAGFADTRGTLFHQLVRAVRETHPKVAIGENVRGLLTHNKGRTFSTIVGALENEGYTVYWKLLRAQFLGVGQKRERVFIIAVRDDIKVAPIFPQDWGAALSLHEVLDGVLEQTKSRNLPPQHER